MVDKRYAVDPAYRIYAENRVDIIRLEQLPKLVPRVMEAYGIADRLPQAVERPRLFEMFVSVSAY